MTATPVTPATRPAPRPVPESIATGRLTLSRERRGPGTVVSLLIHAAIVAFVLWQSAEILGEGGGGPGARGGGGGRGRMRAVFFTAPAYAVPQVELPTPPAVTVPVMAVPVIPLDLARIDIPQPQTKATATGPATGVGPGTGGGQGAGQGPGVGSAVGPGTGGEAGYILQASPRWLIIPPGNAPSSAKGHALRVQFWVAADGRVTRVKADPEIGDAGYRRAFMERMMGYLFNPATTRDGQPVASVYVITVTP